MSKRDKIKRKTAHADWLKTQAGSNTRSLLHANVETALEAGHLEHLIEYTGMTEGRLIKIGRGTQMPQGDKLERLKSALRNLPGSELEASEKELETGEAACAP